MSHWKNYTQTNTNKIETKSYKLKYKYTSLSMSPSPPPSTILSPAADSDLCVCRGGLSVSRHCPSVWHSVVTDSLPLRDGRFIELSGTFLKKNVPWDVFFKNVPLKIKTYLQRNKKIKMEDNGSQLIFSVGHSSKTCI